VVGEQFALPAQQLPNLGVRLHFERMAGRKGARHAHPQRGPVRDDDPPPREFTLHPDEFGAGRVAVLVQPVGQDEPRRVVVGLRAYGVE
jgi:hypothetical protein